MKIIYVVKNQLHFYPPCVSQIRMLKRLGLDIEVLYGTSEQTALRVFDRERIPYKKISNIPPITNGKIKKLIDWYRFRCDFRKEIKKYDKNKIYIWFGNIETLIPMRGILKKYKYISSSLELLERNEIKAVLAKSLAKNALITTACEETRAYIMKDRWNLKSLPYVFPNKPFEMNTKRNQSGTTSKTKEIINKIKNKNVIIYQGLIQNTDELLEFAKALKKFNKNYVFLLMGLDKFNSFMKIKEIYNETFFIEYVPAPLHLEITSHAKIGICFYRPNVLNNAYCAPNKIYEYTGFGIPIICNENPGLKNTVGSAGAAECVKLNSDKIYNALRKIDNNYEKYSKNAIKFYNETDNLETMKSLINDLERKGFSK